MSRLGRYTLLRRLAEGGMGSVYLAEIQGAANFTRRVAIKRILPHLARDPAFLSKFIDEANLMVQLHHGNIIGVQELADADGELYIVMDYLPGRDLKAVTRALRQSQRLMPPDLAAWIIAEVCAGLDYAHLKTDEQGRPLHIVHRDVSPSNILLGADGEVKVADFGIAQARGGLHKSVTGALQGKFVYMSPEQAEGQPLNARSDVFSAGLILYELLSNTRPFAGESETDILRRVRAGVHQGPEALRPGLDPGLSALVMRALAYRPEDRFESAGVMRRALLRYLAEAHSEADARALSGFLHTLFPEGVVPEASPPTPLSMDDALLLQLNGLTPSSRPAHVEGTPSALAATLSRPALTPSARWQPPEAPSGQWTPSGQRTPDGPPGASALLTPSGQLIWATPAPPQPARLSRRALLAALGLITLTLALLWPRPARVQFALSPQGLEAPRFSLMQGEALVEIRPGARLPAEEGATFCAEAKGYPRRCLWFTLSPGENTLRFELEPGLYLRPILDPPDVPAQILIGEAQIPVTIPFPVVDEGKALWVRVHAEGYISDPPELLWSVSTAQPRFRLIKEPDMGVSDAGARVEDAATAQPQPQPPAKRRAHTMARLDSAPLGAEVRCDGALIGLSPVRIDTSTGPRRCEIHAEGYLTATQRLERHQQRPITVTLRRPIPLTIRVERGSAEIFIDGARVGQGVVRDHPLAPGTHTLTARFRGEEIARKVIELREGERPQTVHLNPKP